MRRQNALACRHNYSGTNSGLGGVDQSSGAGAHDFGYISIQRMSGIFANTLNNVGGRRDGLASAHKDR